MGSDMSTNWRISSFSGALLATYFIPTWSIIAFNMVMSPVHAFFERPNVSIAFFISDHLHLASGGMVRAAWLLALGRLIVVAFFVIFLALLSRPKIRRAGGANEALGIALAIGSVISFAAMLMAAQVGEVEARQLHATELLMMLGTAIVLLIERPAAPQAEETAKPQTDETEQTAAKSLALEQS
jgi:hypothetical protein